MERTTPDQAREAELSVNPFRRIRQIRELASSIVGSGLGGDFMLPTRDNLVKLAERAEWNAQYDAGIAAFATKHGVDTHVATLGYGLQRLGETLDRLN